MSHMLWSVTESLQLWTVHVFTLILQKRLNQILPGFGHKINLIQNTRDDNLIKVEVNMM